MQDLTSYENSKASASSKGKTPNKFPAYPQWFFDESERDLEVWADNNFNAIQRSLGNYSRSVDAATLKKIADLIGYKSS